MGTLARMRVIRSSRIGAEQKNIRVVVLYNNPSSFEKNFWSFERKLRY
jgi:hypothetical protein